MPETLPGGKFYTYVLVRTDIPLVDQLVQSGHACLEAGNRFEQPGPPSNLVVLSVASRLHLLDQLSRIRISGIRYALFFEPDDDMGETSACTEPLTAEYRRVFRSLLLWTPPFADFARGPPKE